MFLIWFQFCFTDFFYSKTEHISYTRSTLGKGNNLHLQRFNFRHYCPAGNCIDEVQGYTCRCLAGYSGQKCDVDIDDCSSFPCEHGKYDVSCLFSVFLSFFLSFKFFRKLD